MKYQHPEIWNRHMVRGMEEGLGVKRLRISPEYARDGFDIYLVETSRKDGSVYMVELHRSVTSTSVICKCRAGQKRKPCKHAGLVLYYGGALMSGTIPTSINTRPVNLENEAA